MKQLMRSRVRLLLAFVLCFLVVVVASSKQDTKPAVDPDVYKEFVSAQVSDASDLGLWFKCEQFNWLPLALPDETGTSVLRQPSGEVLPFDPKTFPPDVTKKLLLRYLNTVPSYRLLLVEDRASRSTLFYNENGEFVLSLPPDPGYDPLWFLKETRPELFSGHYTPGYVDYMSRFYDPARIALEVTIIPGTYAQDYLYVESRLAAEVTAEQTPDSGGGTILMRYDGPPVTNICFTAIERVTNLIRVTIAYPYNGATYPTNCFTNRLDVFNSSDLLESWWDLSVTTNVSPSTNWIEWTDASVTASWVVVRFYAAGNADLDSDGDGFADAREIFMYHTDPNDPTSKPVSVSGSISYGGVETGTVYALATTVSNGWSLGCSVSIPGPGAYSNGEVAALRSYWFKAFRDVNTNHARDAWEPWGLYSLSSTYVTSNLSGVNVALSDVPSIWGTISYTGTKTGNVYVVAVTASNSWDTTYSCMIPWVQGSTEMTGGTTYLTFPVGYSITGLPASNYWIRAFIDSDTNAAFTHLEAGGQYTSNSIPVSNRVTGINFTLDLDSDGDQMPNWWEWQYGFNPADSNDAFMDRDNDGAVNIAEYHDQMDPTDADTDDDGMQDGWEFLYGLNPLLNDATNDNDGDGLGNAEEYGVGTFPNNPDSDNDLISDGTNSLTGIFAGPDPNPLTPAPGMIPRNLTLASEKTVAIAEDSSGRPLIAWVGWDDAQKNQVYVLKWFGPASAVAGEWYELNGVWEALGDSALEKGMTLSTNGVGGSFGFCTDSQGDPVVAWSEVRGTSSDIYLRRWNGTNWVGVSGSDLTGGIAGTTNGNSTQPSVTLDSANRPVVSWSEFVIVDVGYFCIRLKKWDGTNWVALAESTNTLGISGAYCWDSEVKVDGQDRPVVVWERALSGTYDIFAKRWMGSSWQDLGCVSTGSVTTSMYPDLLVDSSDSIHVSWIAACSYFDKSLWVRKYTNGIWQGYGGSDIGVGLAEGTNLIVYCQTLWPQTNGGPAIAWAQFDNGLYALMAKTWESASNAWARIGRSTDSGIQPADKDVRWAVMSAAKGSPVVVSSEEVGDGNGTYRIVVRRFAADGDDDGLSDVFEQENELDQNNADTDNDGLSDGDELLHYGTIATTNDTDGDGLTDGQEILGTAWGFTSDPLSNDTDGDGVFDAADLFLNSLFDDQDGDGIPNSIDTDDDNDGLLDVDETTTDPLNPDSDGDGIPDGLEGVPDSTAPVIYIIEPQEGVTL